VNAALETLLLALPGGNGGIVPTRALFLGALPHPALADWPELDGWQPFKPSADAWEQAGHRRLDAPLGSYPLVLMLPGKSRDETLAGFALARDHLAPGGRLLVALPNTAGAGRFEKELARACGTVESLQKHKCRAFHATDDGTWHEEIFAEWRTLGLRQPIPSTKFLTEPGVFSSTKIDPGSALLADHLPSGWRGTVADLGAGWGYLSDAVLQRSPQVARIDLYEADARALACAQANLAKYAQPFGYHWHDVATGVPGGYDAVVMNPPFHTGQANDIELGRAFIAAAAGALRRGGRLWMVANRQLPYESVLDRCQLVWRNIGGDATFKLLMAERR
jgi:16S rRNA (guanine1207-N2)-methyltransferase